MGQAAASGSRVGRLRDVLRPPAGLGVGGRPPPPGEEILSNSLGCTEHLRSSGRRGGWVPKDSNRGHPRAGGQGPPRSGASGPGQVPKGGGRARVPPRALEVRAGLADCLHPADRVPLSCAPPPTLRAPGSRARSPRSESPRPVPAGGRGLLRGSPSGSSLSGQRSPLDSGQTAPPGRAAPWSRGPSPPGGGCAPRACLCVRVWVRPVCPLRVCPRAHVSFPAPPEPQLVPLLRQRPAGRAPGPGAEAGPPAGLSSLGTQSHPHVTHIPAFLLVSGASGPRCQALLQSPWGFVPPAPGQTDPKALHREPSRSARCQVGSPRRPDAEVWLRAAGPARAGVEVLQPRGHWTRTLGSPRSTDAAWTRRAAGPCRPGGPIPGKRDPRQLQSAGGRRGRRGWCLFEKARCGPRLSARPLPAPRPTSSPPPAFFGHLGLKPRPPPVRCVLGPPPPSARGPRGPQAAVLGAQRPRSVPGSHPQWPGRLASPGARRPAAAPGLAPGGEGPSHQNPPRVCTGGPRRPLKNYSREGRGSFCLQLSTADWGPSLGGPLPTAAGGPGRGAWGRGYPWRSGRAISWSSGQPDGSPAGPGRAAWVERRP